MLDEPVEGLRDSLQGRVAGAVAEQPARLVDAHRWAVQHVLHGCVGVLRAVGLPLLQGRVLGRLPAKLRAKFPADLTDAQRALQFARSTPGVTVTLAGMSDAAHVEENLRLRDLAPMAPGEFAAVFES